MKQLKQSTPRNIPLILISLILVILGAIMLAVAIVYIGIFGWLGSGFIGLLGTIITAAAITSIVTNDPSWILLNLLLP